MYLSTPILLILNTPMRKIYDSLDRLTPCFAYFPHIMQLQIKMQDCDCKCIVMSIIDI